MIPLVDLTRQHRALRPALLEAMARVVDSSRFILGAEGEALEAALASRSGVRHGIGVASGTEALRLTLQALGVGPGDEVITPALSFVASASTILMAGATPVFVDIDPETYALDVGALERAIGPRTRGVVAVHLYGHPAPMDAIVPLARAPWAVRDRGRGAGDRGHAGRASRGRLGRRRVPVVLSHEEPGGVRGRRHGPHGPRRPGRPATAAAPPRRRRTVSSRRAGVGEPARRAAGGHPAREARCLDGGPRPAAGSPRATASACGGRRSPCRPSGGARATSITSTPCGIRSATPSPDRSRTSGVGTAVHYPIPIPAQPMFGRDPGAWPEAARAAREVLSLPCFAEMTEDEVEEVARAARRACERL